MIDILESIVIGMKTDTDIFSVLWNRIYIWQPIGEQTDIYLTINIITQIQNQDVNNRTRVELRFIWWNLTSLSNIEKKVRNYLYNSHQSLNVYNIEIWTLANGYDDKKTPVLIRDMIFYMLTNNSNG